MTGRTALTPRTPTAANTVMARPDRAIRRNEMLMLMARSSRAMTGERVRHVRPDPLGPSNLSGFQREAHAVRHPDIESALKA